MINRFKKQVRNCSNCRYNVIRFRPYQEIVIDTYCLLKRRGINVGYHTLVSCKEHKYKRVKNENNRKKSR